MPLTSFRIGTLWTVARIHKWRLDHLREHGQWFRWRQCNGRGRSHELQCQHHASPQLAHDGDDDERQRNTFTSMCGCTAGVKFSVVGAPCKVPAKVINNPGAMLSPLGEVDVHKVLLKVDSVSGVHTGHAAPMLPMPRTAAQLPPDLYDTLRRMAACGCTQGHMHAYVTMFSEYTHVADSLLSNIKQSVTGGHGDKEMPRVLEHLRRLRRTTHPSLRWRLTQGAGHNHMSRLVVTTTHLLDAAAALAQMTQFDAFWTVGKVWKAGWGLTAQSPWGDSMSLAHGWTLDSENGDSSQWVVDRFSEMLFEHTGVNIDDVCDIMFTDGAMSMEPVFAHRQRMAQGRCRHHLSRNRVKELSPAMCKLSSKYLNKLADDIFDDEQAWEDMYAMMETAIRLQASTVAQATATIDYLKSKVWSCRAKWSYFHLCQLRHRTTLMRKATSLEEAMHGVFKTRTTSYASTTYQIDAWLRVGARLWGTLSAHVHNDVVRRPTRESALRAHFRLTAAASNVTSWCATLVAEQAEVAQKYTYTTRETSRSAQLRTYELVNTTSRSRRTHVVTVTFDAAGAVRPCGGRDVSRCSCGWASAMATPCRHLLLVASHFAYSWLMFVSSRYSTTVIAAIVARVRDETRGGAAVAGAAAMPPPFHPVPAVAAMRDERDDVAVGRKLNQMRQAALDALAFVDAQDELRREGGDVSAVPSRTLDSVSHQLNRVVAAARRAELDDGFSPGHNSGGRAKKRRVRRGPFEPVRGNVRRALRMGD